MHLTSCISFTDDYFDGCMFPMHVHIICIFNRLLSLANKHISIIELKSTLYSNEYSYKNFHGPSAMSSLFIRKHPRTYSFE